MGEVQMEMAGLTFNRSIRVEARSERLTENAGAVLLREAMQRTGVLTLLDRMLKDPRDPERLTHPQSELVATLVTMFALGWRDQDDADFLRKDPMLRLAVSERAGDAPLRDDPRHQESRNPPVPQGLASQPTLSRLIHRLGQPGNLEVLHEALLHQAARRVQAGRGHRLQRVTLDVDAVPVYVGGHQPGALYNGHFRDTVYHPLITTAAELGDLLDVRLRRGTAHAAEDATEAILDVVYRAREQLACGVSVRMDAGMPSEQLLSALESNGIKYTARLRNNEKLNAIAAPLLRRPPGRRPAEPRVWMHEQRYRAASWSRERRVVLVVLERPDDLYLHHFWLVTSWSQDRLADEELLAHYRERGTAEGHFGELMDVLAPRLPSSMRGRRSVDWRSRIIGPVRLCDDPYFRANEAALLLSCIAYNLMHALRTLLDRARPANASGWSLRRVRERVLRVASRIVLHGRRVVVVVNQAAATYWRSVTSRWHLLQFSG